jgi:hypothetical protein
VTQGRRRLSQARLRRASLSRIRRRVKQRPGSEYESHDDVVVIIMMSEARHLPVTRDRHALQETQEQASP